MTELCASYGISRKTGYKWLKRFELEGLEGLKDQSRAPQELPHTSSPEVVSLLIKLRKARPTWGAAKLKARLEKDHPSLSFPARSTVHDILVRNGLVEARRVRRARPTGSPPSFSTNTPNSVWCTDFKGEFRTLDGIYCYPLTVLDWATRFSLACEGKLSTAGDGALATFEMLFDTYGVPDAILNDNGVPFANANAICGLSRLNIYWMKLGISLLRSQPGHPEQNPRIERFHRTLKRETTRPPRKNLAEQQVCFANFREDFNHQRPHEALDFAVPGDLYTASTREPQVSSVAYPGHYEVRKVASSGEFLLSNDRYFLTRALEGEHIGLEEYDEQKWRLFFREFLIGYVDQRDGRITSVGPTPVRTRT